MADAAGDGRAALGGSRVEQRARCERAGNFPAHGSQPRGEYSWKLDAVDRFEAVMAALRLGILELR